MSIQDKTLLMHRIDETLKPRMFANLLEEAEDQITATLDDFDVTYTGSEQNKPCDLLEAFINARINAAISKAAITIQLTSTPQTIQPASSDSSVQITIPEKRVINPLRFVHFHRFPQQFHQPFNAVHQRLNRPERFNLRA